MRGNKNTIFFVIKEEGLSLGGADSHQRRTNSATLFEDTSGVTTSTTVKGIVLKPNEACLAAVTCRGNSWTSIGITDCRRLLTLILPACSMPYCSG